MACVFVLMLFVVQNVAQNEVPGPSPPPDEPVTDLVANAPGIPGDGIITGVCTSSFGLWARPTDAKAPARWIMSDYSGQDCHYACNAAGQNHMTFYDLVYDSDGYQHTGHQIGTKLAEGLNSYQYGQPFVEFHSASPYNEHIDEYESVNEYEGLLYGANNNHSIWSEELEKCYQAGSSFVDQEPEYGCFTTDGHLVGHVVAKPWGGKGIYYDARVICTCKDATINYDDGSHVLVNPHSVDDAFSCSCNPGWTGKHCNVDVDECTDDNILSKYCSEEGTKNCNDQRNGNDPTCVCKEGWFGPRCGLIDKCTTPYSHYCVHGLCQRELVTAGIWEFSCLCVQGFTGLHCAHKRETCLDSPCKNEGRCVQYYLEMDEDHHDVSGINTTVGCVCTADFSGPRCDTKNPETPICAAMGTNEDHEGQTIFYYVAIIIMTLHIVNLCLTKRYKYDGYKRKYCDKQDGAETNYSESDPTRVLDATTTAVSSLRAATTVKRLRLNRTL